MSTANLEKITGEPNHTFAVARCFGAHGRKSYNNSPRADEGHGVTWKHVSGATLDNLRCPVDGGPLYQTTRGWRNYDGWTVIPVELVKKAAASKRSAKKDAQEKLITAGTHKRLRDLQPGELFVDTRRKSATVDGKVVSIEKKGSKYELTVSRTVDNVAAGGDWRLLNLPVHEHADKLESLTETVTAPGDALVIVGEEELKKTWAGKVWFEIPRGGYHGLEAEPFNGWAVDHPECIVVLWQNKVTQLTRRLADFQGAVLTGYTEEKRAEAQARAKAQREHLEVQLAFAQERLAELTA